MDTSETLLAAYDAQLRTDAETPSDIAVRRHGPLRLVTFAGGRGFVTYQDLGGADAGAVRQLALDALDHFRADPAIERVEWKTRGHDHAPGLHEALVAHGFVADQIESVMLGEARLLAVDVPLPEGVGLRPVVSTGRLEPVRGTTIAGIWGGATRVGWRGRGIYRALTAARARSALRLGVTHIHSDSTPFSRPILERAGLVEVATTTPYRWRRYGR